KERYRVPRDVPTSPEKIENEFRYWLGYACDQRVVLVIDSLNQLDKNSRGVLDWFPEVFPPYVRVIVSTLEGDILDETIRRGWNVCRIEPLSHLEREQLVGKYFHAFGKSGDEPCVRRLANDAKSLSPL